MATSAEPETKTAYSEAIRRRIIWMRLSRELSFRKIAEYLYVSASTVGATVRQHGMYVCAMKQPPRDNLRSLSNQQELVVVGLV